MAEIGCLSGDNTTISFSVSANEIITPNDVSYDVSASYKKHDRHLAETLSEFSGIDAATISFKIYLSVFLGINPEEQIKTINAAITAGEVFRLVLGEKTIGYRWVIKSAKCSKIKTDNEGYVYEATVAISLMAYGKR